jgi:uncharacterized protein
MDPAQFLTGMTRETSIRRDAQGRWWFEEDPLEHPNLVRAFDRWVDRAEDGRYCLRNDINWAYFTLEGAPFFVRSVTRDEAGGLSLLLSNDGVERLDPATLRQGPDGALYCDVRRDPPPKAAQPPMAAKFERHAMQQLEPFLQQDDEGVYLVIAGEHVRPPVVADPLRVA